MFELVVFNLYDDRICLLLIEYKVLNERLGYILLGNIVFNWGMFFFGRKFKRFESFCYIYVI